jgi:transcriptional antiterminator NusG
MEEDDCWYAIFVKTGEEDKVQQRINYKFANSDFKAVVPKRKLKERKGGSWNERIRTLFPGYVFLCNPIGINEFVKIKQIPGVLKLLYSPIYSHEISTIKRLIRLNETIDFSYILFINQKIEVIGGPLVGLEGLIMDVNLRKSRVKVRLNFIGEPRVVDLGISMVQEV